MSYQFVVLESLLSRRLS